MRVDCFRIPVRNNMAEYRTKYDEYYQSALELFTRTGSVDNVFDYVDSLIENEGAYRDVTLGKVAVVLASKHQIDDALRFCLAILDSVERADSLLKVSRTLKAQGLREAAREFLGRVVREAATAEHFEDTAMVYLQTADAYANCDSQPEAMRLLRRAIDLVKPSPQSFEGGKTLRGCARLLARWGYVSEAVNVAQLIELPKLRASAIEEVQGKGRWPVHPDSPIV